jgi:hypothetical protein
MVSVLLETGVPLGELAAVAEPADVDEERISALERTQAKRREKGARKWRGV